MLLTKEDVPFEIGKDNMAYYDAYLSGAKAQLKKVVEWAVEERRQLEVRRAILKMEKPKNIMGFALLGAKLNVFQQMIDRCGEYE